MFNQMHYMLNRPSRGFDPVPAEYAQRYADAAWGYVNADLVDSLETWIGGFHGKRVLDLGAGPGQFATAFAQRGAEVTWFDISENYRAIAEARSASVGVVLKFCVGYLDDAPELLHQQYDLVFNHICWNYSMSDNSFAKAIFDLMAPGGFAYLDVPLSRRQTDSLGFSARILSQLYAASGVKIGHPFPPPGRVASMFSGMPLKYRHFETVGDNERIFLAKS